MDSNGYRLLLPEGTLNYFDLVDVQETSSEVVIYLEEKNVVPEQYSDYEAESKGFYKPVIPSSRKEAFPESSLYFKDSEYINRKWRMATEDSRITQGFTSFLKELYYYLSS